MGVIESQPDFRSLGVRDLLDAREQYHWHLANLRNVVGTAIGLYLIRDGDVVSAQTTPLSVSKVGFSAEIYEFATRDSVFYGILAIMMAVGAGWLAGAVFRGG